MTLLLLAAIGLPVVGLVVVYLFLRSLYNNRNQTSMDE